MVEDRRARGLALQPNGLVPEEDAAALPAVAAFRFAVTTSSHDQFLSYIPNL
jgi:hypothetical protein